MRTGLPAAWPLRCACSSLDGLITPATSNVGAVFGPFQSMALTDLRDGNEHADSSAGILKPHTPARQASAFHQDGGSFPR